MTTTRPTNELRKLLQQMCAFVCVYTILQLEMSAIIFNQLYTLSVCLCYISFFCDFLCTFNNRMNILFTKHSP